MTSRTARTHRFRGLLGTLASLALFFGSTDLHSASSGFPTVVTTSPVLSGSSCGIPCAHYDRNDGELTPDHPTARLSKQPSLVPETAAWAPALSVALLAWLAEPPTRELLFYRLPPPRGPPSA